MNINVDVMESFPKTELAILPEFGLFETAYNQQGLTDILEPPFSEEVYLTESFIQGLYSNPDRDQLLTELHIDDRISLIREPKNKINTSAIRVENTADVKLGYVGMGTDTILARLMDAGKTLFARISQIDLPSDNQYLYYDKHIVRINIFLQE